MGLMDRVKAQASQLAQQAMEATQEGKAKIDQAAAQRRGEAMLRQLGALVLAERTNRGTPDSQTKIDQLTNEITSYEQANGLNLTVPPSGPFAGGGQAPQGGGQAPQGGGQAPFQGGGGPAPFQSGGGQAPQGGGQDPFQGGGGQAPQGGAPAPDQGGDPSAYQGPTTINQGPFFTAPDPDEGQGSGAAPQ
jgi:hypothetical protein